jgi:anaerobic magnesium-protoporphyrin IX monomethyl ester cyclase
MNKKKKICLIEPPYHVFMEELDPPFPLMYLGAVAERCGWQAEIVDMNTLDDMLPEADLYGVTSTSPQWPVASPLSIRLEQEFPETPRIVGGTHISFSHQDIYQTRFNMAVVREGEQVLEQILTSNSGLHSLDELKNHMHQIVFGNMLKDLDNIPFPARHLIDWKKYKRGIFWGKKRLADAVSIITSRGCPYNCIFCGSHVIFGHRVRFRSVENVVAEIKHVVNTMGYRGMNFHDDTFCVNRKRVLDLCEEFKKLDIVWRCLSRADTIDFEMLQVMNDAGCKEIILGIESGSQKILNILNKRTSVKQNLKAMKLVKKSGIQLKVGIIVGSPGETWETVRETEKLLKACPPDFWNVSVLTPFPGSAIWNNPERYGLKILTRDLSQYAMVGKQYRGNVVVETEKMNKQDIEKARDELIDLCLEISGG